MEPGVLGEILEGNARPGHFRGMLTVVHRLFEITQADYSFFGEKDFQQLALVKAMVAKLKMPIKIFGVPTVRDDSGLALSSRNRRLSSAGLELAQQIPVAMDSMSRAFTAGKSKDECEQVGRDYLLSQGVASIEYLEIRASDLMSSPVPTDARIFIAVVIEDIRLIDNLEISK
jgi:pantoate--beta-alanine ligase